MSWTAILALTLCTYALKAVGPVGVGGREMPARFTRIATLLPASLLAALIAVQTVANGRALAVDARLAGVAVAAVAVVLRAPFLAVIAVGAATAAILRAVGIG